MKNEEQNGLDFFTMNELVDEIKKRVPAMVLIYSDLTKLMNGIDVKIKTKGSLEACKALMEFFEIPKVQEGIQEMHERKKNS